MVARRLRAPLFASSSG